MRIESIKKLIISKNARVEVVIHRNNEKKVVWFETEPEYYNSLVVDRVDGIVVAFLPDAIQAGENIESDIPISDKLYYQLTYNLIPILSKNVDKRGGGYKFNYAFN